jgi:hypothetical protein
MALTVCKTCVYQCMMCAEEFCSASISFHTFLPGHPASVQWGGGSVDQFGPRQVVRDVLKGLVGVAVTKPVKLIPEDAPAGPDVFVRADDEDGTYGVVKVLPDDSLFVRPVPIPTTARWSMLDVDPRREDADAVVTGHWGCGAFGM